MTSSLIRGRPRHSKARIRVRVIHAAIGVTVGAGWLILPMMTAGTGDAVPAAPAVTGAAVVEDGAAVGTPVAHAGTAQRDGTSATDLVLPLAVVGAAGALAGYGYVRRTRRARTRTTPGPMTAAAPAPTEAESERQARAALVLADDCVRGSEEELGFAAALFGETEIEPFRHAVRAARTELSAAFALWRRYEEGGPQSADARRRTPAGVVGRCAEAGRRLDAEAERLDRLRGLEEGTDAALAVAERRFRDLTGRTAAAQRTAAALHGRYGVSAAAHVTGSVEQAKDRLVFATSQLNAARRAADTDDSLRAARQLRAAEGAIAQAGVLVGGVERLAAQLREAAALVPAALTGAEAEIAAARKGGVPTSLTAGDLHARLAHADGVLAAVREELTSGPYDPLDALRRIVRAVERLEADPPGVLEAAALLVARGAVGEAEDFVSVHRGAVGAEARTRLAQAVRTLGGNVPAAASGTGPAMSLRAPVDHGIEADGLARQALDLAGRDVRAHGTPWPEAAAGLAGLSGAVTGGILLAGEPDGGPPVSFGGPLTRERRHLP
ncbi:hypothetical protein [Streptomyces sp. NPDC005573]|uniref:hypothetical protein n=1 Tax=Streptomyces sp. NPDC005573 TaxID=3156890 RepID=UPI0033B18CB9